MCGHAATYQQPPSELGSRCSKPRCDDCSPSQQLYCSLTNTLRRQHPLTCIPSHFTETVRGLLFYALNPEVACSTAITN